MSQLLRLVDDEHDEHGEQGEREEGGEADEPFGARQPERAALLSEAGHFATTAQIAIAADSRPNSTGITAW